MQFRTDLALEAAARFAGDLPPDAKQQERHTANAVITSLTLGKASAAALGRQEGEYITVSFPSLTDNEQQLEEVAIAAAQDLRRLLPAEGTVLVVGLGNAAITPDALGPQAAKLILATRHLQGEYARSAALLDLRSVAVLRTDVLGNTGIESGELAAGVCRHIRPAAVIAIDALAAGSVERLGCTVQISNTGIAPGSGVGNNRKPLSKEGLGVPVIGIGIPTVVDAATLAFDLTGSTPKGAPLMVTPREVDLMIARGARLTAMIVNAALHPDYSPADLCAAAV